MSINKISNLIEKLNSIFSLSKICKRSFVYDELSITPIVIWLTSRIVVFLGIFIAKLSDTEIRWHQFNLTNLAKLNIDWSIFFAWDSSWYQKIVNHGYEDYQYITGNVPIKESSVAFFPAYPLIIKLFNYLGIDFLVAGALISNIAFFVAVVLFYRWLRKNYASQTAFWATLCLAFNPVSLYGSVIYSEGIFILFSLLALQHYETFNINANFDTKSNREIHLKAGYWAGIFGMLTTATRLNGVAIVVSFLVNNLINDLSRLRMFRFSRTRINLSSKNRNYLNDTRKTNFSLDQLSTSNWLIACMSMGGIGSYMLFCWLNFGDPLPFLSVQSAWRQGIQDTYWGEIWVYSFNIILWGWRNFTAGDIIDLTHPIGVIVLICFAGAWWHYRYKVGVNKSSLWVVASVIALWQITTDTGLTIALSLVSSYLLWHYRHQIKRLHWLYSLFCLLVIYASGRTMSLQRFIFGSVTLPISFGILFSRYPYLGYPLITGSGILLFYNSMRWAQKLWVA